MTDQTIGAAGFPTYEIMDTFLADIEDAQGNKGLQVSFAVPGATPVGFRLTHRQAFDLATTMTAWLADRHTDDGPMP
jgi:hypothetical protein